MEKLDSSNNYTIFTPDQCNKLLHQVEHKNHKKHKGKPGGGTDTKKELQQLVGYHLKK